ncbi:MAG TPA: glycoside hydrolase family 3 C-terminal domain-containing protein, partial [Phnomibacter sp.]|nr:glycoside hydrolase family 3 C-terminal domain-containing protein [Phnomibacter sp.]
NNQLLIDRWQKQSYHTVLVPFAFEEHKQYPIRIEFKEPAGNATLKLIWDAGIKKAADSLLMVEAVQAARQSEVAVVVAGKHEGEFQDRASLALDGHQERLIQQVAANGTPVVVLLVGGSAVTMEAWRHKVQAIMSIWYPGQSGGQAVADVLLGAINPAGRLPITFPISEAQLPLPYWHKPTGRGDDYHNLTGHPLFPFGFGLSYTTFEYDNLQLEQSVINKTQSTKLWFTLKNTGPVAGDEVAQLYLSKPLASISQPVVALKGFQRIHLKPGEQQRLYFNITPEILQLLNAQEIWVVEPGIYQLMVGPHSRELTLKTELRVR